MQTCPKCGYVRQPTDTAPDYECPSCGIIYARYDPARAEQLEAQRAALRAKAAKRVEALADKTVELLNAIDSRLTRIEDKQATFEKEAFRSFATKADVAEAKFSIIVWVVSAIFLAQLLPVAASLVKHYFP